MYKNRNESSIHFSRVSAIVVGARKDRESETKAGVTKGAAVANLESLTKGFQSWIKVADHSNTK
jgi:hypothetical protein